MTLQEKINADLKNAMLTNNNEVKSILRVLIGELNQKGKEVSDDVVMSTIEKLIKSAKIVIESQGVGENAATATKEIAILESYLPKKLSEADLRNAIISVKNTNSYTVKDMGKVMSYLKENFAGQYDGKLASAIVKKVLA